MKKFWAIVTGGCIGQLILLIFFIWLIWVGVSMVWDRVDEAGSVPKAIGKSVKFVKDEFKEGLNETPADTVVIDSTQIK